VSNSPRWCLITGAAGGIGTALAVEFARRGYGLLLADLDQDGLDRAAARVEGSDSPVECRTLDVTSTDQVEALAAWCRDSGRLPDVLINNAGVGHMGDLCTTGLPTWRRLVEVNLFGPLNMVDAFLPAMRERGGGHIVNVSSGQAFFRLPTWGAYAAVKAALGVYSEVLGFELAGTGVRVTTVYPFMVDTGFYRSIEGETTGSRLAMRLVPYYSNRPETVAKAVARAVEGRRRVELITPLNLVGFYGRVLPLAPEIIAGISNLVLRRGAKRRSQEAAHGHECRQQTAAR